MLMSSGGRVASSSGCVTKPRARKFGLTGSAVPTQHSLLIGRYVMATAEHREPCESRGSCTVLGAPGGEIPPGDSTFASLAFVNYVRFTPDSDVVRPFQNRRDVPNSDILWRLFFRPSVVDLLPCPVCAYRGNSSVQPNQEFGVLAFRHRDRQRQL